MILFYSSIFHQYLWQNKTLHFVFSVKESLLIAKHSECLLSFMGVSDFKIFMFENSENKAHMNEKVSTLHKSTMFKMRGYALPLL